MQRFAVISDVHANVEALDAVLREVGGMELRCLGDFVDYGAEPNAVIARLTRRAISNLGNHDDAALSGNTSRFNAASAMASIWTRRNLSGESLSFLRGLDEEQRFKTEGADFYLTHASPDDRLWEYVDPRTHSDLFGHYLDKMKATAIGLGHTHVPYVWEEDGRVVFNPGSVGQPRDGDWRASYAVVEVEGERVRVEVRRVEYDVRKAARKIREAGLPESFADRLATGS